MPELPDVEGFRGVFAEHGAGRRIADVRVADAGLLRDVSVERLRETLTGHSFGEPERRGKWLIVPLSNGAVLLLHFGMTGSVVWASERSRPHRHDRVTFALSDGELRFRDMRKLRGIWLAPDRAAADRLLSDVGPDALTVGRREFAEIVGTRRRLKATLMDQAALSGLGNLLTDEICWRARIDPRRPGDRLGQADVGRLYAAMRRVLRDAVPAGCVPGRRSWLTGHRDDTDPACPRCGTGLHHGRVGGRSTFWCPECQPADAWGSTLGGSRRA
jgi:formamidopyrimidine-DNA glycosylase